MKKLKLVLLFYFCLVMLTSSSYVSASNEILIMATTSSADNTGLLDYLATYFHEDTGIELKWVVTGTGKAFELGKKCDVDLLLVHEPKSEMKYLEDFFGIKRKEIMFNNFALFGPASDPARIKGMNILEALQKIRETKSTFISRGDASGTHTCEINLWKSLNISISNTESWYIESGQGMLATLNLAKELNGYTITDIGTYIKYNIISNNYVKPCEIFVEGGYNLKNQYSIILINPEKCPNCNIKNAVIFLNWITGENAQKLIKNFNLKGKKIFIPNAK